MYLVLVRLWIGSAESTFVVLSQHLDGRKKLTVRSPPGLAKNLIHIQSRLDKTHPLLLCFLLGALSGPREPASGSIDAAQPITVDDCKKGWGLFGRVSERTQGLRTQVSAALEASVSVAPARFRPSGDSRSVVV